VMFFPVFLICANPCNLIRKLTLWAALQAVYLAQLGCGCFFNQGGSLVTSISKMEGVIFQSDNEESVPIPAGERAK
jgi:hypothetical protein